jgi:3-methylfumaryl-CoA hydratase
VDIEPYLAWIGRQETVEQPVNLFQAHAMEATLDRHPSLKLGDPLPPLWHWAYFVALHKQAEIAEDGHVARGGFIPPIPLPRRMFAGAQLSFPRPLRIGETARRVSTIAGLAHKKGRTGDLVFMKVHNEIVGEDGATCIVEDQDIVYREAPKPGVVPSDLRPTRQAAWRESVTPTEALLFRYSALIFNAHRIHFDRPYTMGHEGYGGLVVHGQLTATMLADLAGRQDGRRMTGYSFRALRPILDTGPFSLCGAPEGDGAALWAETTDGQLALEASATFQA